MDLTNILLTGYDQAITWSKHEFRHAIKDFADRNPQWNLDWDEGAGENWARFTFDGRPCLLICRLVPLLMSEGAQPLLADFLQPYVYVLPVNDFSRRVFSAKEQCLVKVFALSRLPENFDADKFSVDELWWSTV